MAQDKLLEVYARNLIVSMDRFSLQIRRNLVYVFIKKHGIMPEPYFSIALKKAQIDLK